VPWWPEVLGKVGLTVVERRRWQPRRVSLARRNAPEVEPGRILLPAGLIPREKQLPLEAIQPALELLKGHIAPVDQGLDPEGSHVVVEAAVVIGQRQEEGERQVDLKRASLQALRGPHALTEELIGHGGYSEGAFGLFQ
jgi:hypothetical protein